MFMNASPALRMVGLAAVIALAVACAFAASHRGSGAERPAADGGGRLSSSPDPGPVDTLR